MPTDETLMKLTTEAIEKLKLAMGELFKLPQSDMHENYHIGALGRSIGLVREFQKPIFERRPELIPPLPEDYDPDPPLTEAQEALVKKLSKNDIRKIDETLLSITCQNWRKVAYVVGKTMMGLSDHIPEIPDIYYAKRLRYLVKEGKLESQGDLAFMRYSEVRRPLIEDV